MSVFGDVGRTERVKGTGVGEAEAHCWREVRNEQAVGRKMCISGLGGEAVLGEEMALWDSILNQKK